MGRAYPSPDAQNRTRLLPRATLRFVTRRTGTFVLLGASLGAAVRLVYVIRYDPLCASPTGILDPAPGGCAHDEIFGWQPGSLAVPIWIATGVAGGRTRRLGRGWTDDTHPLVAVRDRGRRQCDRILRLGVHGLTSRSPCSSSSPIRAGFPLASAETPREGSVVRQSAGSLSRSHAGSRSCRRVLARAPRFAFEVGSTSSSAPRRSASSAKSSTTGSDPAAPLPITRRSHSQGMSSPKESGVCPYRARRAIDGPFLRLLTAPRSITRSCRRSCINLDRPEGELRTASSPV